MSADDEYEVAIQAFAVPGGLGDLVRYKNDTVIRDCDLETINELAKYAEGADLHRQDRGV
jgi:hypothetical protein